MTSDGAVYDSIPLRYNAFTDDLEFQNGMDRYDIEPKSLIKQAEFGGAIFSYVPFESGGTYNCGFLRILQKGKATLYVKYKINFLNKDEEKPFVDPKPARFSEVQKDYFLSIGGNEAKVISGKKKLLNMFGEKRNEMAAYFSKNRCSMRDGDGLKKIVDHYNSL